jgi:7,8-dihydroneopterin 2',3'-cyclic phosphate phosphodiesterase
MGFANLSTGRPLDLKGVKGEFRKILSEIKDKKFRRKVKVFIEEAFKKLEAEAELSFFNAPAGRFQHHAYVGGLIEHTLATVRLAEAMTENLAKYYGVENVNRDYVIAGALLHDLYKPLTYRVEDGYSLSKVGSRLDHLTLLLAEAYRQGFPLDFLHVLAASHGEWGPISPRTVEALIVHLADLMDSRLAGEIQKAALNILKRRGETLAGQLNLKEAVKIIRKASDEL